MDCCRFALLVALLVAAAASGDVRRVGITAVGKVETNKAQAKSDTHASVGTLSEVSVRVKSHAGVSFWRTLRKQVEAKREHLGVRGYETFNATTGLDVLRKVVRKIDHAFHENITCKLNDDITYHLKELSFSHPGITSSRECAMMCGIAPKGTPTTPLPCQSFTYNSSSKECKFFRPGPPAKSEWVQSIGMTSGPPCNLESLQQQVEETYAKELKVIAIPTLWDTSEHLSVKGVSPGEPVQRVQDKVQKPTQDEHSRTRLAQIVGLTFLAIFGMCLAALRFYNFLKERKAKANMCAKFTHALTGTCVPNCY